MVIAGIIDFGFLFQSVAVVTNAAREGARIGILAGYSTGDVSARVANYVRTAGLTGTPTTVVDWVSVPTSPGGPTLSSVRVRVAYRYDYVVLGPIAGLFGGSFGSVTFRTESTMRLEAPAAGS
jgi:hypothetical protein